MDTKLFERCIEYVRDELGNGLSACCVWNGNGRMIAGFNCNRKTTNVLSRITSDIREKFGEAELNDSLDYYILQTGGSSLIAVVLRDDYQMGISATLSEANLGVLINLALPNIARMLEEAAEKYLAAHGNGAMGKNGTGLYERVRGLLKKIKPK